MLKTYLNTVPFTRFVLVEDTVERNAHKIFKYIVNQHVTRNQHNIEYFVFEGVFKRAQNAYLNKSNIIWHDFVTDARNWLKNSQDSQSFESSIVKLGSNVIVIVDSLAHVIFHCGLALTYRIFNDLRNNKAVQQIVTVLHKDLLEGDYYKICLYFDNLSTLSINIEPSFMSDNGRLRYVYKKLGGRIIEEIEEFKFEADILITQKIPKPDPKKLLEKTVPNEINPENLSTFRIGLTEEEKLSREKVVLPYLPKADEKTSQEEGKIIYKLDEVDDWDEEDPDDDLEI